MEDFSVLYSYFEKIGKRKLNDADKTEIASVFRREQFKKKERIFSADDENTRHYYIEKGLLRMYIIDQSGKEFNVLFAKERQWLGDLATPAPTAYFLDAVEKTTVFSIDEDGFRLIIEKYMDLGAHIRRSYIFLQKRFVAILSKTAEENYEELLKNDPDLVQRLPQYHISSYLGVTPVFLSKIIAKKARKRD
ncbi:cyclic nucleotide-binding domain-containing protein [uncultured Draconibacterium sp.]|uniref:Crp/Fnr family transcriptional regulator n=1 Tax=uncultured Draconibacterium sp. TaxID=1573823 RepID=UPI0029C8B865|nr:cyclic nucleotide-binding domain-containing protein [uncultured Draconibacterium sp.]